MSNLQYIKLFEAFESTKLSKTLGYIKNSKDKSSLLDRIKRLCNSIDFPYSKLSDEFFDYLPFKKALEKSDIVTDDPCEATSKSEFPDYAIEGEKCTNGKIKRLWGSRSREVVCPTCSGTGIKPKKSEMKLIKFWFNSDGKYVATTGVDGVIRPKSLKRTEFSKKLSNYDVTPKILTHDEVRNLRTGDIVLMKIQGVDIITYIYKDGSRVYALQDEHDGSTPSGSAWRQVARYGWSLTRGEYEDAKILKPKKQKEEVKLEANPYEWNVGIEFGWGGGLQTSSGKDVENEIKDAHFAIIMDFGKIKKSEFVKKYDMTLQRADAKSGSKLDPSQSDKEIKKRNIERYMNELSKRLDISSDITNCNKLISKSLGYRNALYTIIPTSVTAELSTIIDYYLRIMSGDDDSKSYYVDKMKDKVHELFKWSQTRNITISNNLDSLRKKLVESGEDRKLQVEFLDKFNELSASVYKKFADYNIESIEDFEIICQKMISIKNILKSDRYGLSRFCSYVLDYMNRSDDGERSFRYMIDPYYFNTTEQSLESLERVSRIIEKI